MKNSKIENTDQHPLFQTRIDHFGGLPYVSIINIPANGVGVSSERFKSRTSELCNAIARILLVRGYRFFGRELKFMRTRVLIMSMEQLAGKLYLSTSTISIWEKAANSPLHPAFEVALKCILAERLRLKLRMPLQESPSKDDNETSIPPIQLSWTAPRRHKP